MIKEAISRHKQRQHEDGATVMFDSVSVMEIPKRAPAVAGYVDGNWKTFHMLKTTHPNAWRLPIAVFSGDDAVCLDVENGDASPGEAAPWVKRQRKRGIKCPVVYSSVSQMDMIIGMLREAGLKVHTDRNKSDVRIWTAHYTFTPHLCGPHSCGEMSSISAHATQWTDTALGRNLDESLLHRDFFRHPHHGKR